MNLGLDEFLKDIDKYKGRKLAVLANQASCNRNFENILDILLASGLTVNLLYTPEHGFFSEEQDQKNVGDTVLHNIPAKSLYGKRLVPYKEEIDKFDTLIIDIQDIGTRYYTYLWTALLLIKYLNGKDKEIIVLDRPNPLGGEIVQGPVLDVDNFSFVGLLPIPVRHGMTIAELLKFGVDFYKLDVNLITYKMAGWKRAMMFKDTGIPFIPTSPNIPCIETAFLYPGICLLEATNLSEGRGTTRPFNIVGAPFIDPFKLATGLKSLPGIAVRPFYFRPTFNKYKGKLCGGIYFHVIDYRALKPFESALKLIHEVMALYKDQFQFLPPPYEYETEKMPFDILTGKTQIRELLLQNGDIEQISEIWEDELSEFSDIRSQYLLYV